MAVKLAMMAVVYAQAKIRLCMCGTVPQVLTKIQEDNMRGPSHARTQETLIPWKSSDSVTRVYET